MADPLAELFASKVRAAVLAHLLPRPHLGFSLTDLSRILGLPLSSLQHECYKLTRLGVLRDARDGNARRYRPDPRSPLLSPLTALVIAAIGPEAVLPAAVEKVPALELAFLAGRLPADPGAGEPPHLVLVGELPLEEVDGAFARVGVALAAPDRLELAYFRPGDWRERITAGNSYLSGLLAGPVVPLVGTLTPTDPRR
ncbi:MAG: winged helix-turn-helix domain-containing protein [Chloroflexota bacterium]|nr:winged helix-turn-helix domain-containing protein [Chloroflexota bacterium]